jgi:hypothetical protein
MFPAPTFADEPMRFHARVARDADTYTELELSVTRESDGEITCQGNCRVAS